MTFEEALKRLKDGERVTRDAWRGDHMELREEEDGTQRIYLVNKHQKSAYPWIATDIVLATDFKKVENTREQPVKFRPNTGGGAGAGTAAEQANAGANVSGVPEAGRVQGASGEVAEGVDGKQ